ncbi:7182_t:CDS:1, partial [Scutellospora calospora]
ALYIKSLHEKLEGFQDENNGLNQSRAIWSVEKEILLNKVGCLNGERELLFNEVNRLNEEREILFNEVNRLN